jgi:hypothetical protein
MFSCKIPFILSQLVLSLALLIDAVTEGLLIAYFEGFNKLVSLAVLCEYSR